MFTTEKVESTDGIVSGHLPDPIPEELNKKALQIIQRVRDKLTGNHGDYVMPMCTIVYVFPYHLLGNDFPHEKGVDVSRQVQLLINQATAHDNLCQCYIGW